MVNRRDIVDVGGQRRGCPPRKPGTPEKGPRRKFLAIWFRCCHVYGRLYRDRSETKYVGRCPRCGAQVYALIGPNGTSQRMFEAR
jgi:hypothetical protein